MYFHNDTVFFVTTAKTFRVIQDFKIEESLISDMRSSFQCIQYFLMSSCFSSFMPKNNQKKNYMLLIFIKSPNEHGLLSSVFLEKQVKFTL